MLYCREQQLQERRWSEGDLSTLVSGQCRGPAPTEAVLSSSLHADTGQHTGSSRYYSFLPSCLPDSKTLIITLLCCLFTVLGQWGIQAFSHLSSNISVPSKSVETVQWREYGWWAQGEAWLLAMVTALHTCPRLYTVQYTRAICRSGTWSQLEEHCQN